MNHEEYNRHQNITAEFMDYLKKTKGISFDLKTANRYSWLDTMNTLMEFSNLNTRKVCERDGVCIERKRLYANDERK